MPEAPKPYTPMATWFYLTTPACSLDSLCPSCCSKCLHSMWVVKYRNSRYAQRRSISVLLSLCVQAALLSLLAWKRSHLESWQKRAQGVVAQGFNATERLGVLMQPLSLFAGHTKQIVAPLICATLTGL